MIRQILYTLGFIGAFLGLLVISELLYAKYHIRAEITRKLAHTASTLFSLAFLLTFQSYAYVIVLGGFFFLLLYMGKHRNWFRSIHAVERETTGSYLLPLAICALFVISTETQHPLLFVLPILTLGISDPLAGIAGTLYREKTPAIRIFGRRTSKTILGSSVFFVSAMVLALLVLHHYGFKGAKLAVMALGLAILSTLVELVSTRGLDNITVPLVLCIALYFLTLH